MVQATEKGGTQISGKETDGQKAHGELNQMSYYPSSNRGAWLFSLLDDYGIWAMNDWLTIL
jgi:hypothetical protein